MVIWFSLQAKVETIAQIHILTPMQVVPIVVIQKEHMITPLLRGALQTAGMIDVSHAAPAFQRQNIGTWYQMKPILFPMHKRKINHRVIF